MYKWRPSDIKDGLKVKLSGVELTIRETSPNKFKIYGLNGSTFDQEHSPLNIAIVFFSLGAVPSAPSEITMKHIFPGARFKRVNKDGEVVILRLVTADRLGLMPGKGFGQDLYTLVMEDVWDCVMHPLSRSEAVPVLNSMGVAFLKEAENGPIRKG